MFCNCWEDEFLKQNRQKFNEMGKQPKKRAPLSVRMASTLGLKQFLFNKFLFNRTKAGYSIDIDGSQVKLRLPQVDKKYLAMFKWQIDILEDEKKKLSIPVIHIKNKRQNKLLTTIVYSHGNSSDLSDALPFLLELAQLKNVNVIVYDYTGYGASTIKTTTQESICADLQTILLWLKVPLPNIILWGFSLGTFPTIHAAASYGVGGVILQSPLASISSFLDNTSEDSLLYEDDHLNNLQKINLIQDSPIIIFHSIDDEIIPFSHSQKLIDRFKKHSKTSNKIQLIQIEGIGHNYLHPFFVQRQTNHIQRYLFQFIESVQQSQNLKLKKIRQEQQQEEIETEGNIGDGSHRSVKNHFQYFKMHE